MKIYKEIYLYNPKSSLLKLESLGLKIKPFETIEIRSKYPRYTNEDWDRIITYDFGLLLKKGELVISYTNNKFEPEEDAFILNTKPFFRRGMSATPRKAQSSDFIEKLQSEFTSDQLLNTPEGQIAKNTSNLINKIDFDGFEDPLEE